MKKSIPFQQRPSFPTEHFTIVEPYIYIPSIDDVSELHKLVFLRIFWLSNCENVWSGQTHWANCPELFIVYACFLGEQAVFQSRIVSASFCTLFLNSRADRKYDSTKFADDGRM